MRQDRDGGADRRLPGLADPLARMRDNFTVLKGQMGFNNPQSAGQPLLAAPRAARACATSRTPSGGRRCMRYYTPDIFGNEDVGRLAKRPYGDDRPAAGLRDPLRHHHHAGLNFFGQPLGPGDGAYNATQFATKIASVGVWFDGYDTDRLAQMPYVYLLPAGKDVIRPRNTQGHVALLERGRATAAPALSHHPGRHAAPGLDPSIDGVKGQLFAVKPYASFQAFPYADTLRPTSSTPTPG